MAESPSTTASSCKSPQFLDGMKSLEDCSCYLEQARGILAVLASIHCIKPGTHEFTHDQLSALYAADTLLDLARTTVSIAQHAGVEQLRPS